MGAASSLAGIPPERLKSILEKLVKTFGRVIPKQPKSPPPKKLTSAEDKQKALLEGPCHRSAPKPKSCLKKRDAPRNTTRRVVHAGDRDPSKEALYLDIQSHRMEGETLWFTM